MILIQVIAALKQFWNVKMLGKVGEVVVIANSLMLSFVIIYVEIGYMKLYRLWRLGRVMWYVWDYPLDNLHAKLWPSFHMRYASILKGRWVN